MREAEITCLCTSVRLPSLGLTLARGEVAYVPETRALSNVDLEQVRRAGGVQVKYVERCQEQRPPEPPGVVNPTPWVPKPKPAPKPVVKVLAPKGVEPVEVGEFLETGDDLSVGQLAELTLDEEPEPAPKPAKKSRKKARQSESEPDSQEESN